MNIGVAAGVLGFAAAGALAAQEPGPANGFTLDEEVRLGRENAQIVRRALPVLGDRGLQTYLNGLGARLVRQVPVEYQQRAFRYTFAVIDVSDFLSLAMPGGSIFVSRAIVESAPGEAALAGLLAHQISHMALRHGTRQTTRGEMFDVVAISEQLLGAVPGRLMDAPAPADGGIGLSAYLFRCEAEAESEARELAAVIMERAGYDAAAIGQMFETIARQGAARGGPAWLDDHPGAATGNAPAPKPPAAPAPFAVVRGHLLKMPRPRSAEQALSSSAVAAAPFGPLGVDVPAGESRQIWVGNVLQMEIPANWRRRFSPSSVVFAPRGSAFERADGATAFSHAVQIGVALRSGDALEQEIGALLRRLAAANPGLTWAPAFQQARLGGRPALLTAASNVAAESRRFEYISVAAAHLDDRRLLYVIGIAPQIETGTYRGAFTRIRSSIRLIDVER
jgi:hypothetical protein